MSKSEMKRISHQDPDLYNEIWNSAIEEAEKAAQEEIEYEHPMPCPDGNDGCLAMHRVTWMRKKTWREIIVSLRYLKRTKATGAQ